MVPILKCYCLGTNAGSGETASNQSYAEGTELGLRRLEITM